MSLAGAMEQFQPESGRPQDVVVSALQVLGGIAHIGEIVAQCALIGFPQPEPSIRRMLQEHSSDAIWDKARKPVGARDLFYSVDGVDKRTGFWGLRGFLTSAPLAYPISGLARQNQPPVKRADTPLARM